MEKKVIDTYKNHLASLPSKESAGIHIGMYLQWLINNDFISIKLKMDFSRGIKQVKSGEKTGTEFLFEFLEGELLLQHLSPEIESFTKTYYSNPDKTGGWSEYLDSFINVVAYNWGEEMVEVPDIPEFYNKTAKLIEQAHQKFLKRGDKKWYQFWL